MSEALPILLARQTPHGLVVAVSLPGARRPLGQAALAALRPDERAFAEGLGAGRRATWVGGRVALREALLRLGLPDGLLLPNVRGAPSLPPGAAGSISHKDDVAVAIAARDDGASIGVDVEDPRCARMSIARRVLTAAERASVERRSEARRSAAVVVHFAIKEALYKALDPWLSRYVGFQEVSLAVGAPGPVAVDLRLKPGEGPLAPEAWWCEEPSLDGRVLATARVRRSP